MPDFYGRPIRRCQRGMRLIPPRSWSAFCDSFPRMPEAGFHKRRTGESIAKSHGRWSARRRGTPIRMDHCTATIACRERGHPRHPIAGSSAESVGRIEVLLKEVWVGWGRSAGRRDKALAALGARLPRTVGPGRQPAARVLRCAAVLRMTAATDRAGGPCGPAGRLALDRLAASATAERRSVVAEDRRKRPRTRARFSSGARRLRARRVPALV